MCRPGDESNLARRIATAYRASGIAARTHGGKVLIEREEGWEGPIDPTSIEATYVDDIRTIEGHARAAASRVLEGLGRGACFQGKKSNHQRLAATMPMTLGRFKLLGLDDRRARIYRTITRQLLLRNDF